MGPLCAVEGDVYRMQVALSSGTISGGPMNVLTVDRFRFELDCPAESLFVGCPDEGDIIRYVGDSTLTSGGTACDDAGGFPVVWTSDGLDSPAGPNQVIFTPSSPVVLPANTMDGCLVEFDVRVQNSPGLDATPFIVTQATGFDAFVVDASCDNGVPSRSITSNAILLCIEPLCGDVNGSGFVNVGDALQVAQFDVGLGSCPEFSGFTNPENCDVAPAPAGNGECDVGDALFMAQCDAELRSCEFDCTPFECPVPAATTGVGR